MKTFRNPILCTSKLKRSLMFEPKTKKKSLFFLVMSGGPIIRQILPLKEN